MRIKRLIMLIIMAVIVSTLYVNAEEQGKNKGVILIDPGHGGIDGGAKSKNGTVEKEINFTISQKLKVSLEGEGYTVFLTREDDNALFAKKRDDLEARCKMKDETKCDVFISIHQNKFGKESCKGAQVWYANNDKSNKLAKLLQEDIKKQIDDGNKRLSKAAGDKYRILRDGYDGACVILECGFLSNYKEEQKLKTDEHQDKIVEGIKNGINEYFKCGE